MILLRSTACLLALCSATLFAALAAGQNPANPTPQTPNPAVQTPSAVRQIAKTAAPAFPPALIDTGSALFTQNCSFCHGRDAGGGESGPDLTRSQLVAQDTGGDKIGEVVHNGRVDKGMPRFNLPPGEITALSAFIHTQKIKAESQQGGRRGVDVADLQTGSVEAGKQYFNGAGQCSACHSATGDLRGLASRYQGLKLEQRMLYPGEGHATLIVKLRSGRTLKGTLAYHDEFTVALLDSSGVYRSWPTGDVTFSIDAPAQAHADLLSKYTDDDIHNLMAFLQTLR